MSVISVGNEHDEVEARYVSILATVSRIRSRLEELAEELETGDHVNCSAINEQLRELPKTIANCHKAELHLNDQRKQDAGIAQGGYALDLEEARREIACRLARLGCPGISWEDSE